MDKPKYEKVGSNHVKGQTKIVKTDKTIQNKIEDKINDIFDKVTNENFKPSMKLMAYQACGGVLDVMHNCARSALSHAFGQPNVTYNTISSAPIGQVFTQGTAYNKATSINPNATVAPASSKPSIDPNISPSDVGFTFESDANSILHTLYEDLGRYNVVGLDRFWELAGYRVEPGRDYNISLMGWRSLNGSRVERRGDLYHIILPPYGRVK